MMESRTTLAGTLLAGFVSIATAAPLGAQSITDGLMMPGKQLCTGFLYDRDEWSTYWEGTLKRDNLNIGTLKTESVTWVGNYGLTDRINVLGMVPYVRTSASGGTLLGQSGVQDLTLALKVQALTLPVGQGAVKAFAVGSFSRALTDYTPDFYPLSIGSASQRYSGRATLNYTAGSGLYVNGTGAYTWRDDVTIDRASFFSDGRLHYGSVVPMPSVYDYSVSFGYNRGRTLLPITFSRQVTRGGGDIRRQDMPFVSDRMNMSKLDATLLYYPQRAQNLGLRLGVTRTLSGRNVGQSTALQAGLLYVFHF